MTTPWYGISSDELLKTFKVDMNGLSEKEAAERLQQSGPNEIEFKKTPAWVRFARQFNEPMVILLIITALITGTLTILGGHMLPDTIVIVSVVLFNAILGFLQEDKAEGALDALRNMMLQEALVVREGNQRRISAKELVPGDLVVLESGDKIPADIRFIKTNNTHVDESSLTGESTAVQKHTTPLSGENLVPGDQSNMGFSGTYLTQGTAIGLVVETGMQTVFGRIADMVKSVETVLTPLQRKMKQFINTLIVFILILGAFNFGYGIYLGYETSYSFLGAVSLVVAAIPEMLPALVTSVLALSAVAMAKRKALIRKLPAAETLGATAVICSDKTGTLTENRMTVTQVYCDNNTYKLTGTGLDINGEFLLNNTTIKANENKALIQLLRCGFYCNNAHLGGANGIGDPTELALRVSAAKAKATDDMIEVRRLAEIPFNSTSKYMAVLIKTEDRKILLVKGAPEVIIPMCSTSIKGDGSKESVNPEQVIDTASSFASNALRTLAFAAKECSCDEGDLRHEDLTDLCLLGLQGMIDPPKQSAIEAISQCHSAGIRTIMITGDHPDTALAVAKQLGMDANSVLTGTELSTLSDQELEQVVLTTSVFARVAPEHKKAIANALQAQGLVVAMTGDGVNDAPALKTADVGIAMGISGTEVAKESSDMILTDDNFATIVAAVEEGRHAWNNLQKAILYTLPTNAAQVLLIMGAIILAGFIPVYGVRFVLEPVQILWVNLLDSVLLTMPLMMENKEKGLLNSPPRPSTTRIINGIFIQRLILIGLAISAPGFYIYYHFGAAAVVNGVLVDPLLLTQAQTAAFWAILLAHFGYVISARSIHRSFFSFNPFSNHWLLAGIGLSILIRLIPTVIPSASELFRTAPFPAEWWPLILLCILPSFIAIELDKLIRRSCNTSAETTAATP